MNFLELFLFTLILVICQQVVLTFREGLISTLVDKEKGRFGKFLKQPTDRTGKHLDLSAFNWLGKVISEVTTNYQNSRKPTTESNNPTHRPDSNNLFVDAPASSHERPDGPNRRPESSNNRPEFERPQPHRPESGFRPNRRPESDDEPNRRPESGYRPNRRPESDDEPNRRPESSNNKPEFERPQPHRPESGYRPNRRPESDDEANRRPESGYRPNRRPESDDEPNRRPESNYRPNGRPDYVRPIPPHRPEFERPSLPYPSSYQPLQPSSYRPDMINPIENGKPIDHFQLTEKDKTKLNELERKWASLKKQGIAYDNKTRNHFHLNGFSNYHNDYFNAQPQNSFFYPPDSYPFYSPYSSPQNLVWLPKRQPFNFQPLFGYIYNLNLKNMFIGERCLTPNNEAGFCRLVEDCPIRPIISDYANFLKYSCTIGKHGVGVCCPANYRGDERPKPSTPKPATSKPQTARPSARPNTTSKPTPKPTAKPTTAKPTNARKSLIEEAKSDCGYSPKTRIVGGKESKKDAWPWAIPIFNSASYKDQFCGGALISRRHVLTASHCMVHRKPKDIFVRVGAYNIQEEDENENAFNVVKIVSHKQYNNHTNANDISILTLDRDVPFNANINPVCIPNDNEDYVKQNATVIGWGTTSYSGTSSSVLQEVSVPVWALKDCQNVYGKEKITDKQICAGLKQGGKDSCQGDSGGPLLRLSSTRRRFEVIGVVSYGFRCAEANNPGVYTRVNKYYKWILDETTM